MGVYPQVLVIETRLKASEMSEYKVCPHCNETVSTKVYKDRRRLYYSKEDKTWINYVSIVRRLYSTFYPLFCDALENGDIELPTSFLKVKYITVKGQKFESGPNAYYLANSVLPFRTPIAQPAGVTDCHLQPVTCLYYAVHRFFLVASSDPVLTVLARVRWPQPHPDRYCVGKPVEVWCPNLFESSNCNAFLPVENMQSQACDYIRNYCK